MVVKHLPQAHGFELGPQRVVLRLRAVGSLVGSSWGKWADGVGLTVYTLVPLSVISISGLLAAMCSTSVSCLSHIIPARWSVSFQTKNHPSLSFFLSSGWQQR